MKARRSLTLSSTSGCPTPLKFDANAVIFVGRPNKQRVWSIRCEPRSYINPAAGRGSSFHDPFNPRRYRSKLVMPRYQLIIHQRKPQQRQLTAIRTQPQSPNFSGHYPADPIISSTPKNLDPICDSETHTRPFPYLELTRPTLLPLVHWV